MNRFFVIALALVLLCVLIWHAIWRQGPVVEADLALRVETALAALDATHVRVDVDGQEIGLRGSLATESQRGPLLQAATRVRGVVSVHDHLQIVPGATVSADEAQVQPEQAEPLERALARRPARPAVTFSPPSESSAATTASAVTEEGATAPVSAAADTPIDSPPLAPASGVELVRALDSIQLRGEVDSPATRDRLRNAVRSLHPGHALEDSVQVTRSAPLQWNNWLRALELLRPLDAAQVVLTPSGLRIGGRSDEFATAVSVRETIRAESNLLGATLDIQAPNPASDDCQNLYNDLLSQESIRFGSNSAEIDPASHNLLNRLSTALDQCQFAVEIAGHTDATGEADYNLWLSQQRADAVRSYLLDTGVRTAIVSRGYGAQRPLEDNKTSAGRRANRRIEFNIKSRES